MGSGRYVMAFDAGGGGGHCLLVEIERGRTLRTFRAWQHPAAPGTGGIGSDLDLTAIWTSLAEAAREALQRVGAPPAAVLGIAATSMRMATVVVDRAGQALFAAPNRDGRAVSEAFMLAEQLGEVLYARTGHWPSPVAAAARLRWLASSNAQLLPRAAAVLSLSDWVAHRLCGEIATDPSQAGETLLFDITKREWAWDLIDRLELPRHLFPPVRLAGARLGALTEESAALLGLRAGIPVAVGGGDTQCGLLGAGAVTAGQTAVIGGTTVPVALVLDRVCVDGRQRLWTGCHVMPDQWVLESNAGTMGEMLSWLASVFFPDAPQPVARFLAEAGRGEPGAAGMLSTLGADVMNARQLRVPLGSLTLSHLTTAHDPARRRHLLRAVLEGMACSVRANLEQLVEPAGSAPHCVALAGGLSRSDVFAQTVSDVANLSVCVGATGEASALGAAVCAGVAAGLFPDLAAGARHLSAGARTFTPDAARATLYGTQYAGWQRFRAAHGEAQATATELVLPAVLRDMSRAAAAPAAPAMRPRILATADLDDSGRAALERLGELTHESYRLALRVLAGDALAQVLAGVHVLITEVDVVDAAALEHASDLRIVAACRGDAVNVDVAACTAFGIPVLYAPGRNADAVADLTIAFLLMLARKLPAATGFLRQPGITAGDMARLGQAFTELQGRELWHKVIGLVGLGEVGRAVARRLGGFGATILVADPYLSPEEIALAGAESASLDELLERSDFVSLHAPANAETRGLLATRELARMKPGACLINTARAALVDEAALADALRHGHLAGAALDVFSVEPPGSDHPLLALDSVIATPHVGGNTVEVGAHQGRIVADDLARLLRGERPLHILNPQVLAAFDWTRPRVQPDARMLAELAAHPAPAVSDLQRQTRTAVRPSVAPAAAPAVQSAVAERMRDVLSAFVGRLSGDAALRSAAAGKHVTLHFTVPGVGASFYLRLEGGEVAAALGEPAEPADVELRMPAALLDGMFMGTVNPMKAALQGQLSFSGDSAKAMALQALQADLSRIYRAARSEAGDPGDLSTLTVTSAVGAPPPVGPADIRVELVQTVNELYAHGLITATGGNVSARDPARENEIWITPGQLFKGQLRPEMLVRLDLDGRSLDSGSPSPSSERLVHCAVYRARPDAQAIVHAHAPQATILADAGLPFLPISTEAAFFGDIPRVPFIMPGTEELAAAVAEAAARSWAVLMQNHGLLVAGRSLRRAADMVEIIERSAEIILGCYAVGKPPPTLPAEIVLTLQKMGDLLA